MDSLSDWISRRADVWQGQSLSVAPGGAPRASFISTGYSGLDDVLPGSGWPGRSLVELQMPVLGCGELRLLSPLLREAGAREQQVVWIDPPYIPYPQALQRRGLDTSRMLCIYPHGGEDILWTMEKLLRCHEVGVVLAWRAVSFAQARRLKLAAVEGDSIGFLLRIGKGRRGNALPVPLRIQLTPLQSGVSLDLFKMQGSCDTNVQLNWSSQG